MKTKSDFYFLGYRFSMELIRMEGIVSLVKGKLISVSNLWQGLMQYMLIRWYLMS